VAGAPARFVLGEAAWSSEIRLAATRGAALLTGLAADRAAGFAGFAAGFARLDAGFAGRALSASFRAVFALFFAAARGADFFPGIFLPLEAALLRDLEATFFRRRAILNLPGYHAACANLCSVRVC
jgi:hypothetical protein